MPTKNTIIKGTLILTISGIISRLLGFYYKIFLSDAIGLEGFGLYQMCLPVVGLSMCICCGGIQTALQKHVAASNAKKEAQKGHGFLISALLLSICMLIPVTLFLYIGSEYIAGHFLGTPDLAPLLQILSLSLFPSCLHSCINAYFLGCSKTLVPSVSQLLEQIVRVGAVYLLVNARIQKGLPVTAASGIVGLLFGELASSLYCTTVYLCKKGHMKANCQNTIKPLISMAAPLTANRFLPHLFHSLEASLIPTCLCLYGNTYSEAVSTYGIITGMAMSLIMLPSTFINSFAVMLLPSVSAAHSANNEGRLEKTGRISITCCLYVGILCTAEFITFGKEAGFLLFGEESLGPYIQILAWLCPFMYLASTSASILHGLEKTGITFGINMTGTIIRIIIIILLTPTFGIRGVLMALLIAQLIVAGLSYYNVQKIIKADFSALSLIAVPSICALFSSAISRMLYQNLNTGLLPKLLISGCVLPGIYLSLIRGYETQIKSFK